MTFKKKTQEDFPIVADNPFKRPAYQNFNLNMNMKKDESEELDEGSYMEYDQVSLGGGNNQNFENNNFDNFENDGGSSNLRANLDETVKRNIEKYEFKL